MPRPRRHTSYKLQNDAIENTVAQLKQLYVARLEKRDAIDKLEAEYSSLAQQIKHTEEQLIELLQRRKHSIVIDCVEYRVVDGRLEKSFIFNKN